MTTWTTHHPCPWVPPLDPPYKETEDRINPHFGHMIQPLGDGAWLCTQCDAGALSDWYLEHGCDGEVAVEYDVGRGPEDFYRVHDELVCDGPAHHVVPEKTADRWVDEDIRDYAAEMYDRYEEAREAYYNMKEDK